VAESWLKWRHEMDDRRHAPVHACGGTSGWIWNDQHGRKGFNLWTLVVLGFLMVPYLLYGFARLRKVSFLLFALLWTYIAIHFGWLVVHGRFR
jgi:hypothetical protein